MYWQAIARYARALLLGWTSRSLRLGRWIRVGIFDSSRGIDVCSLLSEYMFTISGVSECMGLMKGPIGGLYSDV